MIDEANQAEVLNVALLKVGDKVTYVPSHGAKEHGIVKSIRDDGKIAWVVYHCAGNWNRFRDYTGAGTSISDLRKGWI